MKIKIYDNILHKYEKESSKLRIGGGSWSIKKDLLLKNEITMIVYETQFNKYTISLEKAMRVGFARTLGFEAKLVVPIRFWEKVAKKEDKHISHEQIIEKFETKKAREPELTLF